MKCYHTRGLVYWLRRDPVSVPFLAVILMKGPLSLRNVNKSEKFKKCIRWVVFVEDPSKYIILKYYRKIMDSLQEMRKNTRNVCKQTTICLQTLHALLLISQ